MLVSSVSVLGLHVAQPAVLAHPCPRLANVVELDVLNGVAEQPTPALAHGHIAVDLNCRDLIYSFLSVTSKFAVLVLS